MRRSIWQTLVFALALAVQVLGAATANIAMAQGASGGSVFEVCAKASGLLDDGQRPTPGHAHGHHANCLLCQACCDGVAPVEPASAEIGKASVQWTALSWTVADCALPVPRRGSANRARAPPSTRV